MGEDKAQGAPEQRQDANELPENVQETQTENVEEQQDFFTRDYVEELRAENARRRVRARELAQELERLRQQMKEREENELAEQQQWRTLADKRQKELEELRQQLRAREVALLRTRIASEYGLTVVINEETGETLGDRLRGENEDELRADAQRLAWLAMAARLTAEAQQQSAAPPEHAAPAPSAAQSPAPPGALRAQGLVSQQVQPAPPGQPAHVAGQPVPGQSAGQAPAHQAAQQIPGARGSTTAVPGGRPESETDEEKRQRLLGGFGSSPMFREGQFKYTGSETLPDELS